MGSKTNVSKYIATCDLNWLPNVSHFFYPVHETTIKHYLTQFRHILNFKTKYHTVHTEKIYGSKNIFGEQYYICYMVNFMLILTWLPPKRTDS